MSEAKVAAVQTQLNGMMDSIDIKILRPRMVRASPACPGPPGMASGWVPPIRLTALAAYARTHRWQEGIGTGVRMINATDNSRLQPEKPQGWLPGTFRPRSISQSVGTTEMRRRVWTCRKRRSSAVPTAVTNLGASTT